MKTPLQKSLMIELVENRSSYGRSFLIAIVAVSSAFVEAQDSWSDSAPRVMKIARVCPLKVRDKNGEWANFKDTLPVGRSVIGAVNPRRPDIIFFQLTRDSKFMFIAPRSCFEGEENWNELKEEELNNGPALNASHKYLLASFGRVARTEEGGGLTGSTTFNEYGVGYGFENLRSEQWYFGAGGALAYGRAKLQVTSEGVEFEDSVPFYTFMGFGSAYYDFKSLPYAMGIEPFIKYSIVKSSSATTIEGGNDLSFGAMLGWRFYADNFTITPKLTVNFSPRDSGFQIQFASIFGKR